MDRLGAYRLSEAGHTAPTMVIVLLKLLRILATRPEAANDEKKTERSERLEIYKIIVEMADRVSQRRQAANSFYLSINTLLVGGSAYLGTSNPAPRNIIIISVSGFLVSLYWIKSIESYKTLNTAKFSVINEIEQRLIEKPFSNEWKQLDPDGNGKRHKPFHKTERLVPFVFMGLYLFQITMLFPWNKIAVKIKSMMEIFL